MNTFVVKSCTLPAISLGRKANSLRELRDELKTVPAGCLYMHFWGNRLFPRFVNPDYHNDFAIWAYQKIHDQFLAERLCVIDPMDFPDFKDLRNSVIQTIERRMNEIGVERSSRIVEPFHFVGSKLIILNTHHTIERPDDLASVVTQLASSSIFYHFIDAKMRTATKADDFSTWLQDYSEGYDRLIKQLRSIDASFLSLSEIKKELIRICTEYKKDK